MSAHREPRLDVHTDLGTVLHHWVKKYSQRSFLEPQCLRYKINELVAQFLALGEESQEILFKPRNILFIVPLKRDQSEPGGSPAVSGRSLERAPID